MEGKEGVLAALGNDCVSKQNADLGGREQGGREKRREGGEVRKKEGRRR